MESRPLVSICCAAFNHEAFIERTLDSFLMQEVDFPYEIVVSDDASTDRTPEILRDYEQRYPDLFRVAYYEENQYSLGKAPFPDLLYPRTRGRYIALCEGDDWWCDPHKLQTQVDFMESHPGCVLTSGGYEKWVDGRKEETVLWTRDHLPEEGEEGRRFGPEEMSSHWLTKTLTVVFRKSALDPAWREGYDHHRDVHLHYHVMQSGWGFYFDRIFGVYNVHEGGIHSLTQRADRLRKAYLVSRELYERNGDDYTRRRHLKSCVNWVQHILYTESELGPDQSAGSLLREAFPLVRTPREAKWYLGAFLKRSWQDRLEELLP